MGVAGGRRAPRCAPSSRAAVLASPASSAGRPAAQAGHRAAARSAHVVIVGVSGLRWTFADAASTPTLWRLAGQGSVGALVDYAEQPLACPDDGWLTLNGGARAQGPRPCAALPAVPRPAPAPGYPAMAQIVDYNQQFHESPTGDCWPAWPAARPPSGPGAALALATAVRRGRLLPAVTIGTHRAGAGPLSADRHRSRRSQLSRTDRGDCRGSRPRADRGRPPGQHHAPRHRARSGPWRPPASARRRDHRARLRSRPAAFSVHQAAGDRDAHRPDADGRRLARPHRARRESPAPG